MSNKSGASNQIISLPKGGGALHGMGEKFSPDLHTGTGNFTIPIALPPGRNGFQPQLNLVYSTGNGNGPFGLGWNLTIPGISRKTSKGIPVYDDDKDTFILSGAEDLVPVKRSNGVIMYRPRTEGLFAPIEHYRDARNDYWQVQSKDGLVSLYGARGSAGNDPATVADPSDRTKVFAWKLSETKDPFGNRIEYKYLRDSKKEKDGPHHWDQLYLKQIQYADYSDSRGAEEFLVYVSFEYSEPGVEDPDKFVERPDPFSEYRAGFEIRTRWLCKRIVIRTHADRDRTVRAYRLTYGQDPHNGVSLLRNIQVIGYDDAGNPSDELPPPEFGYTHFEPEKRDFFPLQGTDLPASSLGNPDLELVDLFGNGLPDMLEMNGTVRYWRNLGNGRFDLPRQMAQAPAGLRLADPGVQMIDADGDGRTDLLVTTEGMSGYYPLRFGGMWDRKSFQRYQNAPSFDLKDPEVKLVDLDGDGVTDVIRSGTRLECFFNDPHKGWTKDKTKWVERKRLEDFPNVNFSDPRVKWGDMTGDGLQDILLVYDGNMEYWPNLGHGNWGKRIHMKNSPRFPYAYDPKRILVGDVDGDGLADIIYVDDMKVMLWINQSGNRWSAPIEIKGTPPVSDMDAVRLVDMLGTGVSGVLWSQDAGLLRREHIFFLDFTGGIKPYLLNEMNNHMGAVTRVEYRSSTDFYIEDQKSPKTRWRTPLPFPVQVVAKVEVIDEISKGKLTTEYRYHHGYWDGAEREFRGFGMVEQLDTESFVNYGQSGLHGSETTFAKVDQKYFSHPTLSKTWFHQGPIGEEFGEWEDADWSNEYWSGDPQLLKHTESVNAFLRSYHSRPNGESSPRDRRIKRDALRTLRGSILRTELYALDDTDRQDRPYTVAEHAYGLREESQPGSDEKDRIRIFFPHLIAQRTTQWERGDDPMTQFSFTDKYDEYGQPQRQTQVACPRGWRRMEDKPTSEYLTTRTVTEYARQSDPNVYIKDHVAKATTYEITNRNNLTVLALRDMPENDPSLKIIGQALNFYDGNQFIGLDFGKIGKYGAMVRTENLVLTDDILQKAYGSNRPPYLAHSGPIGWTSEYLQDFRSKLPQRAGYRYEAGGTGSAYTQGYFVTAERRQYDFHDDPTGKGRGLVLAKRDPLGYDTTITYDAYDLLPEEVKDPAGLKTKAEYDYRVLQPREIIDANNKTKFVFSPLGLLKETWVKGKDNPRNPEGDRQRPSVKMEYDFLAFKNSPSDSRQPIFVKTIRQVHHDTETDVALPERNETIMTFEYSDGFGRLVQTRTQGEELRFGHATFGGGILPAGQTDIANTRKDIRGTENRDEDNPNVIVSGWQIYDNKGRVVEKYEPFFSEGWEYSQPKDSQLGEKATMFYDPRGQVIRTVNPDGSEQRVIYGVPVNLNDPEEFDPSPWGAYTYDTNDNAGRTHPADPKVNDYRHHWNTPASIVIDALGRTVETIERNRSKPARQADPLPPINEYRTASIFDIRGNLLTVTDSLGRVAFKHIYDLANHPLRIESIDAGVRRIVLDAAGNEIERRDSKEALILRAYDELNRPIRLWARDETNQKLTLREHLIYGDNNESNLTRTQAKARNLLGKLYQYYDEAGLLTFESYDFKGNLLNKTRQVIADKAILAKFSPPPANWKVKAFRVDWDNPPALGTIYLTTSTYDAMNRIKTMQYPKDVDGERKELLPIYNRAGALEGVKLDGEPYLGHIVYNAKGQRVLIAYGNGVMTRYAYDPKTFRLIRMRTEHYSTPAASTYHPTGPVLQDFAYEYDLAGNILAIHDRTPDSGIPNTTLGRNGLDRLFTYDPLYRLLSATGRETDILPPPPPSSGHPWDDLPRSTDVTRARAYGENYMYDPAGNMTELRHAATGNPFTRTFTLQQSTGAIVPDNNRLKTLTIGSDVYRYTYDDNGNMTQENSERHFEWDHSDRMRIFRNQAGTAEPSEHAHYLYDAGGQRVMKFVRKQGGEYEVTIYIDGIFEHHRLKKPSETERQNNYLHVMDNQSRIAMVRIGNPFPDDASPAVKYHLGDHLGSSNVVIGGQTATGNTFINREEYFPYGETSFGSFAKKRYRFTGKERDEESGLYYHGARYYAPWLGRWVSCDPAGMVDGMNLYQLVRSNPMNAVDHQGFQTTQKPQEGKAGDAVPDSSPPGSPPVNKADTKLHSAWKVENEWTDDDVDAYREYVRQRAIELMKSKSDFTCEDFVLSVTMDFARERGLPFLFKNETSGTGIYNASDPKYKSFEDFREQVLKTSGAPDLLLNENTKPLSHEDAVAGDIILNKDDKGVPTHVQLITRRNILQDFDTDAPQRPLPFYPSHEVLSGIIRIHQGSSGALNMRGGSLLGANNPNSPLYTGKEITEGKLDMDLDKYTNLFKGYHIENFSKVKNIEFRGWNFENWNPP